MHVVSPVTPRPIPILRPGRNVWRVERAARAAVLIDGANFFRAVREALLAARRSVLIVGWDINSRTPLVGVTPPTDGYPVALVDVLTALVKERPQLDIRLLLWGYPAFFATEREWFPSLVLDHATPPQVMFRLDDRLPLGSSQHQKIVLIDDCVAFSGGFDMTIRRWDTPEHRLGESQRVDPAGKPYAPFHDVQMMVDGDAARALGDLAKARWLRAGGEAIDRASPIGDVWPKSVAADFADVSIGIARTEPKCDGLAEVREVEALFEDTIDAARHAIYIENQFVTSLEIAQRLARRMRSRPQLEALIVTPQSYHSWIEGQTMRVGRRRFADVLAGAGMGARARLVYPEVCEGGRRGDTMVHSKVTIVDDRILRIGSANLNNRSMGTDTECDLVIEAERQDQRDAIRRIRDRLMADHCGVSADEAAAAVAREGGLLAAVERLSGRGHRLSPIDDGEQLDSTLVRPIEQLSDPREPITAEGMVNNLLGQRRTVGLRALVRVAVLIGSVAALIIAWRYTPLADVTDPELLRAYLGMFEGPGGAAMVIGGVALASLLGFPVTVLIAATAATFGPWLGAAYAGAGAILGAVGGYGVGTALGRKTVATLFGSRLAGARRGILQQGIFAVTTLRLVPIAPFVVINIACGAFGIRLRDFVVGTVFGMAPGIVTLAALGNQFHALLTAPTQGGVAVFVALLILWIGLAVLLQRLVTRGARL